VTRKNSSNRNKKSSANRTANYLVGYGKPPLESRFKTGTSGNARGRPKGSKNLKTLVKEAMTASISIQEGDKTRKVSRLVGVLLRQLQKALTGSDRAAVAVFKIAMQLGLLDDADGRDGAVALSGRDEEILNELFSRARESR
jgi:hypothetical protein